jgi:hypothetical protein
MWSHGSAFLESDTDGLLGTVNGDDTNVLTVAPFPPRLQFRLHFPLLEATTSLLQQQITLRSTSEL